MLGVPVPSGTENLVKGWAAVCREHGLATNRSSGDTFFKPQLEYWWCTETMSNFWHTESFTRVSSRVNQNANTRCYAQACSLDVILQRHINFKAGGELFNSPGVLWLNSLRPLFLCHARLHHEKKGKKKIYICMEVVIRRPQSRAVLAEERLFVGKQFTALRASSHHISRMAGGFS